MNAGRAVRADLEQSLLVALGITVVLVVGAKILTGLAMLPLLLLAIVFFVFAVGLVLRLQSVNRHR